MAEAVLAFTRVLAWAVLVWAVTLVGIVTVGRALETPTQRWLDEVVNGRVWPPRVRPLVLGVVAAAWLWATWGVQGG